MALLEATLVSFDAHRGVLVFELEGSVVELAPAQSGRSYLTTPCFDISHRGPVDRPSLQRAIARIRALEPWLEERFTPASAVHVLAFALQTPKLATTTLSSLPASTTGPSPATLHHLEFHAAFFPESDLHAFLADATARKRDAITKLRPSFRDGRHHFVFGVSRSGTRWATSIVHAILSAAGVHERSITPAFDDDGGRSLVDELTAGGRRYLDPDEDPLLETLGGDPLLLGQLACGPRDILVAKADPALARSLAKLPQARFVHIRRDPRNVALSQRAFYFGATGGIDHLVRSAITELESCTKIATDLGAIHLRYEDLVASPSTTIASLATALGYPLPPDTADALAHQLSFASMAPGRQYGQLVDGEYFRGGSSWSAELTQDEQHRITKQFGDRLRSLGYPDP